jgi:hypothetical protein
MSYLWVVTLLIVVILLGLYVILGTQNKHYSYFCVFRQKHLWLIS